MALRGECSEEGEESALDGQSNVKCLKASKNIELLIISSVIFITRHQ